MHTAFLAPCRRNLSRITSALDILEKVEALLGQLTSYTAPHLLSTLLPSLLAESGGSENSPGPKALIQRLFLWKQT